MYAIRSYYASFTAQPSSTGWHYNLPVAYVARVFRTVPYTHPDAAAMLVLAKLLRAEFLHREIREKGGAYGGMAGCNADGGLFSMLSYRDPHLERTLDVYQQAVVITSYSIHYTKLYDVPEVFAVRQARSAMFSEFFLQEQQAPAIALSGLTTSLADEP